MGLLTSPLKVIKFNYGSEDLNLNMFQIVDGYFSDNYEHAGDVGWADIVVSYKGITYAITDADTADAWIYWTFGADHFDTSATLPALTANDFLVGINGAGTFVSQWTPGQTINAQRLNVATLSAITADLGTITAGTITLTAAGHIKSGQTAYNTGTGFWLGIDGGTAKFSIGHDDGKRMTWDGTALTICGTLIAGSTVPTSTLDGLIGSGNLNVADRGWIQTCVFASADIDTVQWGIGTFVCSDGTTYNIGAGNTGDMTVKTYVYLDTAVSVIAYQVTTTAATAVGAGKVLVAVCNKGTAGTTESSWLLMDQGGINIDATSIIAGSITANEIAASTITAGKLNVTTLSSIVADLGTITAGTITGATIKTAAAAKRIELDVTNGLKAYDDGGTAWLQIPLAATGVGALLVTNIYKMTAIVGALYIYGGATTTSNSVIMQTSESGTAYSFVRAGSGTGSWNANLYSQLSGSGDSAAVDADASNAKVTARIAGTEILKITSVGALINGGVHVGGTSDPGDNNLLVDGTLNVDGETALGADTYWDVAGAGLPYGSCAGDDLTWTVADPTPGAWTLFTDAAMVDGQLNLIAHDGSGKLTVTKAGRYLVGYSTTISSSNINKEVQLGISINGASPAASTGMIARFKGKAVDDEEAMAGIGVISLAAAATIEVAVCLVTAGNNTISVHACMITAVMVGG